MPLQVIGRCWLCDNFKIYWLLNWKKLSPACVSTSQMNFIVLRLPQSSMKKWCGLEFISHIINCVTNELLSACVKTEPWWWQNNPKIWRISNKFPFNTRLNFFPLFSHFFPILSDLLGPIEPEILIFFQNSLTVLYNSSFNTCSASAFFWEINMALNNLSHKTWPQICILSSMERWDLGMGQGFWLHNFINKVHAAIDTELWHVWISLTFKLDKEAFKFLKVRWGNF